MVDRLEKGPVRVQYEHCDIKDGCFLKGDWGEGYDFESACEDYFRKISGKTLVFGAGGSRRQEVTVL